MKKFLLILFLLTIPFIEIHADLSPIETSLPLKFNTGNPSPNGLPSTIIIIQGKKIPIIFDTGAKKTEITLSESALKNLHVAFTGRQICSMAFDGRYCGKEFIIPEVILGSFVIKNVTGTVMSKLWGGQDKNFKPTEASRDGVIGYALLSKFNVLLDYAHEKAILIKPNYRPSQYNVTQWASVPFQGHLLTQLKINNKPVMLSWDTGAVPSGIIKRTTAKNFTQTSCAKHTPYRDKNCLRVKTTSFTTMDDQKFPNTWFMVDDIPSFAPFDGLVGSNFYQKNLVYFDFDQRRIYVRPNNI